MEVVPIVMTMHWEEKCKSVKRCFFKVKMVWCWWWWYFPRRGFYRLIWHEKAYAFGSEKEVIKHEHICCIGTSPYTQLQWVLLHTLLFWFANIHELWKLCLSAFDYWEESSLPLQSSNCSCGCVFLYIPFHTIGSGYGLWHVVPSCGYLVMLLMTLGSSKKWWNG